MSVVAIYLSIAFLVFCNGQEIKTPITETNPINVVKHKLTQSVKADKEILDFIEKLPFGLQDSLQPALLSNITNSTEKCLHSLVEFFDDIRQLKPYTLQVVDAWGKLESGVLRGNVKWSGRYYECINAHSANFSGKYCQTFVGKPQNPAEMGMSLPKGITVGSCFPDTCPASVVQPFLSMVAGKNLTVSVQCPIEYSEWEATDSGGLFILFFLVTLVIVSTGYEYVSDKLDEAKEKSSAAFVFDDSLPASPHKAEHGTTHRLLTSFSLIQNTKRLLDTTQRPSDITCLHGMRFMSMSWVLLGHSFLFSFSFANNPMFIAEYYISHWEFQAIGNAFFSVDTFFFLSGLLVVYLGLRTLERRHGKMDVPMMYLLRYLRLTPAYAFVLFMMVSVYPHLGGGPLWSASVEALKAPCRNYWYTNLLYFSNLYPVGDLTVQCFGWGWYLSNDTQFYLVAPLFLYLFYKWPLVGLGSAAATLTSSIIVTGTFSSITHQQPTSSGIGLLAESVVHPMVPPVINGTGGDFTTPGGYFTTPGGDFTTPGGDFTTPGGNFTTPSPAPAPIAYSPYMQDLYGKPWFRIGAYIVGLMTGYVLYTYKKIKMPKIVALLGWVMAAATSCSLLYGLFPSFSKGELLDNNTAAFYNAVSRPLWCVAMAWVAVACVNGYGGPINTLLSWKAFIPLSRLTYCAYLVHPLVIFWLAATQETLIHFNIAMILIFYFATLIMANMVAYVVAMLAEFPVIALMKILQDNLASKPKSELERAFLVNGGAEQDGGQTEA